MHFAFPPRKTSHPPPYAPRQSRSSFLRRRRLQVIAALALGSIVLFYLLSRLYTFAANRPPSGTPRVVIVTPLDPQTHSSGFLAKIKENRKQYAATHGYATCFPEATDYDLQGAPLTWARVPAMRHALALYPYSTYFFHLDQTALVMNPSLTVEDHIMSRPRLESLMLKDQPIVPPESVIKTFSHLRGDRVDLVLTQDGDGLSQTSFILRQGDWAKFFLDTWFDPLYRSYNFQKAEAHALEHIVQWHSTILTKLALIPQRTMNAYSQNRATDKASSLFGRDDFVITFSGCDDPEEKKRSCDSEIEPFWKLWQQKVGKSS